MGATGRMTPSDDSCPVCGVVPMGKNAEHGCYGCELCVRISAKLRKRFGEVMMRHGRRLSPKARAEVAAAAEAIGQELVDEWDGKGRNGDK